MNEEKYTQSSTTRGNVPAYYKDFPTIAHPERFEVKPTINLESKYAEQPQQHSGSTKERTGGYDWEIYRRLHREHKLVVHPRTREIIVGATEDSKPKVNHKLHLGRFPTVAYHRAINRVQVSGKFVVLPRSSTEKLSPTDTAQLKYQLHGDLVFKNTAQYKTVWNTRYQRRSKA